MGVDGRVLEVVDPSRLELEALLSPADSLPVRVGQKARLQLEGSSQDVTATVVRINPSAQGGSRTVPVYLRVDTASASQLRQGMFVQGLLSTGQTQVLAVELDAVRTDKPRPYVQAVQNGRIARRSTACRARMRRVNAGCCPTGIPAGATWCATRTAAASTRMPSSSSNSRARARSTASPSSTLPPGNSHRPPWCLSCGRLAISTRPSAPRITAAAGMAWLLRGGYGAASMAICSMIGDVAGMICDGASNSCAMKVSTSAAAAYKSVLMALDNSRVTGDEGIVEDSVDASIANLCALACGGMVQTDRQILEIMINKAC